MVLTPDEHLYNMIEIAIKQGRTLEATIPLEDEGEEHMHTRAKQCTDACALAYQTRGELTREWTR